MRTRLALLALCAAATTTVALTGTAAAGGGCHSPDQTDGAGDRVELSEGCMAPTVLHVDEGAVVTFANVDPVAHNIWGVGWGRDPMRPGDELAHRFDTAGTFPYTCTLHPGMSGAIVVGDAALPAEPIANVSDVADVEGGGSFPATALGAAALAGAIGFGAGRAVRRRG